MAQFQTVKFSQRLHMSKQYVLHHLQQQRSKQYKQCTLTGEYSMKQIVVIGECITSTVRSYFYNQRWYTTILKQPSSALLCKYTAAHVFKGKTVNQLWGLWQLRMFSVYIYVLYTRVHRFIFAGVWSCMYVCDWVWPSESCRPDGDSSCLTAAYHRTGCPP